MWAKQSTAATLIVGPILDSAGAEYTSAVIGDLSISKNGGTLTALASAATLTVIANGQYTLVMTTGNLDTLGRLQITCNKSTYQMPTVGLVVVPAMVFDSMVLGTDVLQSDTTQFGGTAITAAAGIPEVKVASIAANAVNASSLATDAVTEIQSGIATQTSVDDLPTNAELATALGTADDAVLAAIATVQSDTNDIQTRLPAALESGRIAAVLDSAATAALVDLIWDEPLTGATHNVSNSSGKRLRQTTAFQQIDSTVVDASATTTTFITGLTSAVDNFYNDSMLVFTDGALAGQVRAIYDYVGATKTIILEEALTSAPVNGVAFAIVSLHIHPVSQIQSGLATPTNITAGTITTVTNLTNAPTAGDLTAAMKASVTAAVPTAAGNASAVRTELTAELADIVSIDGRLPAALVSGFMSSALGNTDHGGAAATLTLSTIDIQPASADTPGVLIRGTGSAAGIDVKGGEYADGIKARSGDTSGYGICSNGAQGGARFWSTNGYGIRVSSDNSNAFSVYAGVYAFQINSLNNAIDVYSSTGNAVYLQSAQNDAVVIYPGADDVGVHIWGGQTSGDAVALSSNGTGSVFYPVDLSGLNDLSAAEVNAQVLDVLSVDTFAELAAPPAATSSLKDKITWLFMYARNKVTQTAAQRKVYLDDGTTVAGTSATSDNGTTFTKGEDA